MRKANIIEKTWIILQLAFYMLQVSVKSVFMAFIGKLSRKRSNKYIFQWARRIVKGAGITYKVFNPHNVNHLDGERYIIMANHSSHLDIPLSCVVFPNNVRMLVKQELRKIPLFGKAMYEGEFVFIDRKHARQALKDLHKAEDALKKGLTIWISPEGTRSLTGKLGRFKKGGFVIATETKAKIIPIGICGANQVLPPKTWDFHVEVPVEVHIGEPIDASEYTAANIRELMDRVEDSIEQLANTSMPEDS